MKMVITDEDDGDNNDDDVAAAAAATADNDNDDLDDVADNNKKTNTDNYMTSRTGLFVTICHWVILYQYSWHVNVELICSIDFGRL